MRSFYGSYVKLSRPVGPFSVSLRSLDHGWCSNDLTLEEIQGLSYANYLPYAKKGPIEPTPPESEGPIPRAHRKTLGRELGAPGRGGSSSSNFSGSGFAAPSWGLPGAPIGKRLPRIFVGYMPYMYIHIYIYIYVYVYFPFVYTYIHTHTHIHICVHVYVCTYMYIWCSVDQPPPPPHWFRA